MAWMKRRPAIFWCFRFREKTHMTPPFCVEVKPPGGSSLFGPDRKNRGLLRRPSSLRRAQIIFRPAQTPRKRARFRPAFAFRLQGATTDWALDPARYAEGVSQVVVGRLTPRAEDSRPEHSVPELPLAKARSSRMELFHAPLAQREPNAHGTCLPDTPLRNKSDKRAQRSLLLRSDVL